ncbi:MAG TPA: SAM-dependent methyltransferase [Pyrinomonadaceae bacterium]|nr:SAM-dependent methyltransferase [Pyrinomonadaceae bacterium]
MTSPEQTPLAERLRAKIRREGAISFRDWMAAALYDEREGYYCRTDRPRWGRIGGGDYRTSPERTPLFAATCARYFAALHDELGAPPRWSILEAGAGAGDFARVALETLERFHPRVFHATRYYIDEASVDSRLRARENLSAFAERIEFCRTDRRGLSFEAGVIFSNELLDAFPVHRVRMRDGRLREMCVATDAAGGFRWSERELSTPRLAEHFARLGVALAEGQIAEVNLAAGEWIERAAAILQRGYLVTFDYGAEAEELYRSSQRRDGTLRGFREHRFVADVLAHPGEHDLTTTINWTQVRQAGEAAGLETISFERQDEFLLRAGLLDQLERLTTHLRDEAERLRLTVGAREMILPGGMGGSFQVLVQKKRAA